MMPQIPALECAQLAIVACVDWVESLQDPERKAQGNSEAFLALHVKLP